MKTKEQIDDAIKLLENLDVPAQDKIDQLLMMGFEPKEIYILSVGMAEVLLKKAPNLAKGP